MKDIQSDIFFFFFLIFLFPKFTLLSLLVFCQRWAWFVVTSTFFVENRKCFLCLENVCVFLNIFFNASLMHTQILL